MKIDTALILCAGFGKRLMSGRPAIELLQANALWCGALERTLPLPEKRDDKDHAGNQEKHTAEHRPEMTDAGDDKAYRR